MVTADASPRGVGATDGKRTIKNAMSDRHLNIDILKLSQPR